MYEYKLNMKLNKYNEAWQYFKNILSIFDLIEREIIAEILKEKHNYSRFHNPKASEIVKRCSIR